jgi:hypothetical protein
MFFNSPSEKLKLAALALLIVLLFLLFPLLLKKVDVPRDDFVAYWAAARLFDQEKNPYAPEQLLQVQKAAGRPAEDPLLIWYPPWALPLLMPFGLLNYLTGRVLWLFFSIMLLSVSALWIWRIYKGPALRSWLALVLAGTFAPALFSLAEGQVTVFILLGLVGFLGSLKNEKPLTAGLWASLLATKPQLLFLFWPALLLWSIQERNRSVLMTAAVGLGAGLLVALLFNPDVLWQYRQFSSQHPPDGLNTVTLGAALRWLIGYEYQWLQFIPPFLGLFWLVLYWRRYRTQWDWSRQLPPILFACLITTSFAWMHDETILLIPIIRAYTALTAGSYIPRRRFWVSYLMLNGVALSMIRPWRFQQTVYIWLPWAFLLLYLAVLQFKNQKGTRIRLFHFR